MNTSNEEIDYLFSLIAKERDRQRNTIELIASENFVSNDVLRAVGSCLTNKYAEGYPGNRYYGGCTNVDAIEQYCQEKWKQAFGTDYHVNVQPHSGSQANAAVYHALLQPGDTVVSMKLENGSHLSHGASVNFSGKLYNFKFYGLDANGRIDYDDALRKAIECKPKLIVAGASAYPRVIDFKKFKEIADAVGAYLMVDMAHIAGLVLAGDHPTPFGYADVITTTTHKTLRSTRGGLIFCKPELAKKIDSAIFPGTQGGPLMHIIAGKAVGACEACTEQYREYVHKLVANCKAMAEEFLRLGHTLVTGGTDNHLLLLDLTQFHVSGLSVQDALDKCNITLNKNCVPGETLSPRLTSGVRIGTAAMTTRGFDEDAFRRTAFLIDNVIRTVANGYFTEAYATSIAGSAHDLIETYTT